jgi:hypothetical protein
MFDPVIIVTELYWRTFRPVANLLQRPWTKTWLIGPVARRLGAITLDMPRDVGRSGKGTIYLLSGTRSRLLVQGVNTDFLHECSAGDYISVGTPGGAMATAKIDRILSTNQLLLSRPFSVSGAVGRTYYPLRATGGEVDLVSRPRPYFLASKIDRSSLYSSIMKSLNAGNSLLVFPEGVSHDPPGFLPFRGEYWSESRVCRAINKADWIYTAGVAAIALEDSISNRPSASALVPCAIQYSKAQEFRSEVHIYFLRPISIPKDLQDQYRQGEKDEAQNLLLGMIQESIQKGTEELRSLDAQVSVRQPVCKIDFMLSITHKSDTGTYANG